MNILKQLRTLCVLTGIFQIFSLFAINTEFSEINKNRFIDRHKPVIVMGTNDGYAKPTAVSIESIKGSSPEDKSIIVLYNELSKDNISMLELLSDGHTTVVTQEIDKDIQEQAKKYATNWNLLVQERIFYPEIFEKLNKDKIFLDKVGIDSIRYFIHLDSDTLVLRNIFDILGHVPDSVHKVLICRKDGSSRDVLNKICFGSTNLNFISFTRWHENIKNAQASSPTGISGGVVVWDLDAISKESITPAVVARRKQAYYFLYNSNDIFRMYEILCNSEQRGEIAQIIQHIMQNPGELENILATEYKESSDIGKFFKSFSKIRDCLSEAESSEATTFQEFWDFLYDISTDEDMRNEISNAIKQHESEEQKKVFNPTEEDVMTKFDFVTVPEKYNFIMKNIFPEIDASGQKYLNEWSLLSDKKITTYTTLLREHLLRISEVQEKLIDNFKEMVVMHFDCCYKPWSKEFQELAETNPSLQIIIDIYKSFEKGIGNVTNVEKTSKEAIEALEQINVEEALQKVKN